MDVLEYIYSESRRQSATVAEMAGMCKAYNWLLFVRNPNRPLAEGDIKAISGFVTGKNEYRRVPAVFNQGSSVVNAERIPHLMSVWIQGVIDDLQLFGHHGKLMSNDLDPWIHEFLSIHPFADGNGRVASLLRNYLLGTLSDPTPLPYYFGEQ